MADTITFDQGHGNLIDPLSTTTDEQSFSVLLGLLEDELGFEIGDPIAGKLTPISLAKSRVFVIAAPTGQLTGDEINYIWHYVQRGGGLLLLNNTEAFQYQVYSLNTLAERAGCRFGFYAAHEPPSITDFALHYVSGSVDEVRIGKAGKQVLSRIVPVQGDVTLEPIARNGYSLLLAVGTYQEGRIVVVGNTAMFSNECIGYPGNRQLALNTFRWLAKANPFEFSFSSPHREVEMGQDYVFEMSLWNPTDQPTKIHEISIKSSVNDDISPQSIQDVTVYPNRNNPEGERVLWKIKPRDVLGDHVLRLRIHLEQDQAFYRHAASFTIVMPTHSRLTLVKKDGGALESALVDEPFELVATGAISSLRKQQVEFTPILVYPQGQVHEIQADWPDALRWTLVARVPGTYPIALRIKETGQTIQSNVVVKEPEAKQIETINARFVKPLDDEIRRVLSDFGSALAVSELAQIQFSLLPIKAYMSEAFPFEPAAEQVWDVVDAAFWEERENERVVADLLYNLAPMYMPRAGAFIPFAPDLINHLLKTGTSRKRELLINFLKADSVADIEMRRQIASYLSHEKYGHGFFYTCTELGQQLAILDKHKFLDKYAAHILDKIHLKVLYNQYRRAIEILQHSALIVNEGFAAWLELNVLRRMAPEIHAIIPERQEFMRKAQTLRDIKRGSIYFEKYAPVSGLDSPYEEARQYLDSIQGFYAEEYGVKCAIQAFLVATSISLDITDKGHAPDFSLQPDTLENTLLEEGGDARSDMRLWRISRVLEDTTEYVRTAQEQLQCHRTCLHPDCPVRMQIAKKLGWRASDERP